MCALYPSKQREFRVVLTVHTVNEERIMSYNYSVLLGDPDADLIGNL